MNSELLLLIKKHTDTLIEQTNTKPKKTLEFILNKQMETFFFSPPINLIEDKWFSVVTSFKAMNSVILTTDEKN